MVIAVVSLLVLGLGCWPWFVIRDYEAPGISLACALGMIPVLVVGVIAIRKFNAAGLCGFMAGACCFGVFLFLRLGQLTVAQGQGNILHTSLHPSIAAWLPAAWAAVSIAISVICYPKTSESP